jgi:hypothetical protein
MFCVIDCAVSLIFLRRFDSVVIIFESPVHRYLEAVAVHLAHIAHAVEFSREHVADEAELLEVCDWALVKVAGDGEDAAGTAWVG